MTQTHEQRPSGWGAPGGDRWSRRPRRSTTDRKIAGVAGGLGRAIGVDPVLVRVGFVILTIFGGFGALLYVLGWLLLPADGDEVSAAESLIGRGRSSVPPILAVGLAIVALISLTSIFSWGLPFWPLVIGGVIAFIVVRKHRAASCARTPSGSDWGGSTNPDAWDRWGEQAGRWGQQAGDWVNRQPWTGGGPGGGGQPHDGTQDSAAQGPAPQSPFDRPAFWDEAPTGTDRSASGRGDNDGADDTAGQPARPLARRRNGIRSASPPSPGTCRSRRPLPSRRPSSSTATAVSSRG